MPASTPAIVIRETVCKTVLNRSPLGGYSLNCYTGCTHACAYCYARFMQRFHPHAERWGRFVDVKVNAVETLKRQLRRLEPGDVFLSSACDGWQPVEARWRLTRRCCELLLERGFRLSVLTKNELVARDFDIFRGRPVRVGVTLTSLDESLRRLWEPRASSVQARIDVLEAARREGLRTSVMFGPVLPGLSDGASDLEAMFRQAEQSGVEAIWVDALNPRPRVWSAVAELLRAQWPELLPLYRKMLFDKDGRAEYLVSLQERIHMAARRAGVSDRLGGCVD